MSRDHPLRAPGLIDPAKAPEPLEVLRVPHVFSQSRLLDAPSFCQAAKERGLRIELKELESLHRRRLLIPLLSLHTRVVAPTSPYRPTDASWFTHWDLFAAYRSGRVRDPSGRRFRPWPKDLKRLGPRYSRFQLLGLRVLAPFLGRDDEQAATQRAAERRAFRLEQARTSLARTRSLSLVLEVLSPGHLPHIVGSISATGGDDAFDELRAYANSTSHPTADGMLTRLEPGDLLEQAEGLLRTADEFDPMGDFARVVRIATPGSNMGLRFHALLAHEHRIAAELLLRHVERRIDEADTEQDPEVTNALERSSRRRLTIGPAEQAQTVMDFQLSDRPAICIAVEGPSEDLLFRRTLDLYGIDRRSSLVTIVDRKGAGADVALLARAIAVPRVIADHRYRDALRIQSPLTALLVVNDPENKFTTPEGRARVLSTARESILASLPLPEQELIDPDELDHLLHVEVWNEEFEFAHFTDAELATAIMRVVESPPKGRRELEDALRRCRSAKANIRNAWKSWPRSQQPSKVLLADALWPVLETHILDSSSDRRVPLRDVVERALEIVGDVRSAGVIMTRTD